MCSRSVRRMGTPFVVEPRLHESPAGPSDAKCFTGDMRWQDLPRPDGISDVSDTEPGFIAAVSIPVDDEGFFGRECPACEAPFKMRADEYDALPDDQRLTCPYCGHQTEHGDFMSAAQEERALAAAGMLAEQFVHQEMNRILSDTFGRRRSSPGSGGFIGVEISYTPGSPPPLRALPDAFGDVTRRTIECSTCGNHHAVYSIASFCPVCGPRPAREKVLEEIEAARAGLSIEDGIADVDTREGLRAQGVFERTAIDALKSVVGLFEMFAWAAFEQRAPDHVELTKGKGNVFQRLDHTAQLFADHADVDLVALVGDARWGRLKRVFAYRHVHVHNGGLVDQRFLDQASDSALVVGQRAVISRADAQAALDDLEFVVRELP